MAKCDHESISHAELLTSVYLHAPFLRSVTESGEVELQVDMQHSTYRAEQVRQADLMARVHGGLRVVPLVLVPVIGVLLTIHLISKPEVTSHPEV